MDDIHEPFFHNIRRTILKLSKFSFFISIKFIAIYSYACFYNVDEVQHIVCKLFCKNDNNMFPLGRKEFESLLEGVGLPY